MSDVYNFKVYEDEPNWIVIDCFDPETADLFDDFLVEKLEQEISLRFEENRVSFFFSSEFTQSSVTDLFLQFKREDLTKT